MSAQATSAPASASTSQNCLPRPLPAPVTSATLPSRLNRSIGLPTGPSPPPDRTYLPEYSPPRNRGRGRFPALATTTTTVIYRTARTTSQPGAGDAAWLLTGRHAGWPIRKLSARAVAPPVTTRRHRDILPLNGRI